MEKIILRCFSQLISCRTSPHLILMRFPSLYPCEKLWARPENILIFCTFLVCKCLEHGKAYSYPYLLSFRLFDCFFFMCVCSVYLGCKFVCMSIYLGCKFVCACVRVCFLYATFSILLFSANYIQ